MGKVVSDDVRNKNGLRLSSSNRLMNASRRIVLSRGLVGTLAALGLLEKAFAQLELDEGDAAFQRLLGYAVKDDNPVTLTLPPIAENGHVVKVGVNVDSPMTAEDYVESITVITESNPNRTAFRFEFTPLSGKASAQTRIRLARSQTVIAAVKTNTGKLLLDARYVEVTVGGCGV